ncbi:MAG TPA: Gfo/Idh/MocA family oxidoreductase, partial [Draconibacterium sp.]|nr:Gfo/Idh/MocA family oxidoreductase [Draconibacterium sp.]
EANKNEAKLFSDYREMYKLPGLQSVIISTPTHWHALQFIDACKTGLHVFLEKPISYDIREGQAMVEAHRKANNVVLVDFPRVMADTNDQVKAFIQSGEAGRIIQAHANINNNEGALVEKPIPETIDFERYCGPAPFSKYMCSEKGTTPVWRGQHDFSRGIMMDWGIHYVHNIRKIMDLDTPNYVSAIGGVAGNIAVENPNYLDVQFDFGGLPVSWSHKTWGFTAINPDHNIGITLFGEKGTIFSGDLGWEFYPKGGNEKIAHGDVRFRPGAPGNNEIYMKMFDDMFSEFADGIRNSSNKGITNTLEDAFKTTSTVIFGDLTYLVKSGINIDKATMNISNNDKAQGMLKRAYRNGYKHPYSG